MAETKQLSNADRARMKRNKKRTPEVSAALHVIKGAIVKVLHTPLTVSTQFDNKVKGRLTVEYTESEKPTQAQVDEIQDLANQKIQEDVPIVITQMPREEAEKKYRDNLVNETFIYDKFPVPESVKVLSVLEIKDWNVNCITGEYPKSTKAIKGLKILRLNFKPQKKSLQFCFELGEPSALGLKVVAPKPKPVFKKPKRQYEDVNDLASALTDFVIAKLKDEEDPVSAKRAIEAEAKRVLTQVQNTSYACGMKSLQFGNSRVPRSPIFGDDDQ